MPAFEHLAWTDDVAAAGWLRERLGDRSSNVVTDVVPAGFEAYGRVLHPAADPAPGGRRLVRWRDVAAWSGRPLTAHSPFHAVAMPERDTGTAPPWSGTGPRRGSLAEPDARAVLAAARRHTRTPEDCWFCLWDGDGTGIPAGSVWPDSAGRSGCEPADAASGPLLELPSRRCRMYRGPIECALVRVAGAPAPRTANLWWPEDRAWCVATEPELSCTYVGGSVALVRALAGDPGLEAFEVAPDDSVAVVEPRIAELVAPAVDALFGDGHGSVVTPVGCVDARLQLPRRLGSGAVAYTRRSATGADGAGTLVLPRRPRAEAVLRETVARYLQDAVIGLVGG